MQKSYRVKKEKEFQHVFYNGQNIANRQLVIYVLPKDNQQHFRVGLSVGKKIGNAVKRNRVKRYLRQAIHELSTTIRQDIDFIVIARQDIQNKNFHEIKSSLIHVMKLAQIIKIEEKHDH